MHTLLVAAMATVSSNGCQLRWRIFLLKSIASTSSAFLVNALGGGVALPPTRAGDAPLAAAAFFAAAIDFLALNALLSACNRISLPLPLMGRIGHPRRRCLWDKS